MNLVIDTNILIKYAMGDDLARELFNSLTIDDNICVNDGILNEYKLILQRKKLKIAEEIQSEIMDIIKKKLEKYPDGEFKFNKDREDIKFLSCAKISNADYFISEDKALFSAQWKLNTKIVSMAEFLDSRK